VERALELRSQHEALEQRAAATRRAELDARIWQALLLLSGALALVGWSRTARPFIGPPTPATSSATSAPPAPGAAPAPMSLPGATMSLMAALLAAAILRWGAGPGLTAPAALAIGGAFGAGAILGPLRIRGRRIGPAADRLGMVCLVVSTALLAAAALQMPGARPWALMLPMGALILGWIAGAIG